MDRKKLNFLISQFFKYFIQGIIIIGPAIVTISIIWYIITYIDNIIPVLSDFIPGLSFLIVILGTAIIGWIGSKFLIGQLLINWIDTLLMKMPGIKFIYTSIKDVTNSFVGDKKKFKHPALVKVNDSPEIWRIGFIAQNDLSYIDLNEEVAIYLPHSYAISGWVILTNKNNIKILENISAADAMKFAVSGGISGFNNH